MALASNPLCLIGKAEEEHNLSYSIWMFTGETNVDIICSSNPFSWFLVIYEVLSDRYIPYGQLNLLIKVGTYNLSIELDLYTRNLS